MKNEAQIQAEIRLAASGLGWLLWRNNVGACVDAQGRHIRYGLCNESQRVNRSIKSSDLIGIRPVTITADMVGHVIGQLAAIEVKREGWKYSGSAREQAQTRFIELVRRHGGYAKICAGIEGFDTGANEFPSLEQTLGTGL